MIHKFLKIIGIGFILSVKKLLPILFLFAGFQANAAVITSADVYDDGTLEWLHFNHTIAKTAAGSLELFSDDGFRMATGTQAREMVSSWFGLPDTFRGIESYTLDEQRAAFIAEFRPTHNYAMAMVEGLGMFGANGIQIRSHWNNAQYGQGGWDHWTGYLMVRDSAGINQNATEVPEPSIIALFGLGLVGIGLARRRRS
jgi:hypothetical protein